MIFRITIFVLETLRGRTDASRSSVQDNFLFFLSPVLFLLNSLCREFHRHPNQKSMESTLCLVAYSINLEDFPTKSTNRKVIKPSRKSLRLGFFARKAGDSGPCQTAYRFGENFFGKGMMSIINNHIHIS